MTILKRRMGKISPKFENYKNEKHNLLYLDQ